MFGWKLEDTRVYQQAMEEGREEGREQGRNEGREQGREEEARSLILRLLNRKLGAIPDEPQRQIQALSLTQLEALGEALLDFSTLADLEGWLQAQARG